MAMEVTLEMGYPVVFGTEVTLGDIMVWGAEATLQLGFPVAEVTLGLRDTVVWGMEGTLRLGDVRMEVAFGLGDPLWEG